MASKRKLHATLVYSRGKVKVMLSNGQQSGRITDDEARLFLEEKGVK